MKNKTKIFALLSFLVMILVSIIPSLMFIYSDYKSADSFQIYGTIIFSFIILVFILISDMKKLKNIIILALLNLIFLFIPATVFYLALVYGSNFINNTFGEIIYKPYFSYVISYTRTSSISSWIGPVFFLNIITILIALLEYLNEEENKQKDKA